MSDVTKILTENQKEMLKLIAPAVKKPGALQNFENSDSEPEALNSEHLFQHNFNSNKNQKRLLPKFQNYTGK